ncbi:MAG: PIN domain-containing protein [Archaeoglobaceae archaeon]
MIIDTNIFYNFLFETDLTDRAEKVFEIEEPLFITFTIWNETAYIISRKIAEKKFGIRSYTNFRELIAKQGYGYCKKELGDFEKLIQEFEIAVLKDYQNISELQELMDRYRLLPNDALIAATCKHYGIRKIATFDEDFKRVDFIEVLEL